MHVLREGGNYGWPFTYYDPLKKARMVAPEYGGDNQKRAEAGKYPDPLVAFPAHWAPLQMAFYSGEQFPAKYRGGAFIAFHGSWNRAPRPQKGYNVVFVPFDDEGRCRAATTRSSPTASPGVAEFTKPARRAVPSRSASPSGPTARSTSADSEKGRVWRIVYTGESAGREARRPPPPRGRSRRARRGPRRAGPQVYPKACATCHMADGSGVPGLQPAARRQRGRRRPTRAPLIRVLLRGPATVLPAHRNNANQMPPFAYLSDQDDRRRR